MKIFSKILICISLSLSILFSTAYTENVKNITVLPVSENKITYPPSKESQNGGYVCAPFTLLQSAKASHMFSIQNDILPEKYDLRLHGSTPLTEIKNQPYSNCWAYAAIASLESNLLLNGTTHDELPDLSEEYLQFIGNYRSGDITTFSYRQAGNREIATALLAREDALVTENSFDNSKTNYPFSPNNNGNRTATPFFKPTAALSVHDVIWISDINPNAVYEERELAKIQRNTQIKQHIMTYGAVMTSYYSFGGIQKNIFYNSDTASYYYDGSTRDSNGQMFKPDHAVCIVGWDDAFSKENFNSAHRPKKNGAWIVRNSWGTSYGEKGYFYISYEDTWIGTSSASFIGKATPYHNSYTHSDFGMGAAIQLESGVQLSSVFDSSEIGESLTALSTYITQIPGYEGVNCSFFARQREPGDKTPQALTNDLKPLSVKQYDDQEYNTHITIYDDGYFTFTLKEPLALQGKPFEIVMKLESVYPPEEDDGEIFVMPVLVPFEYNYPDFSDYATAKQEECYIYTAYNKFIPSSSEIELLSKPRWLDFMSTDFINDLVSPLLKISGAILPSEPLQLSLCLYAHTKSSKPKGEVTVFTNTTDTSWSGTYFIGQYDKEGRLLKFNNEQTVLPTNNSQSWTKLYLPEFSNKCKSAKTFLWNTLPSLTPLTHSLTISSET